MISTSLEIYDVRVRKAEDRKGSLGERIDKFGGRYDLLTAFKDYVESLQNGFGDDAGQKYLFNISKITEEGREVSGLLRLGAYGQEAEIIDTKSLIVTHRQKVHEARLIPFYFLLAAPRNVDEAIFISQRSGVHGIHGVFWEAFNRWFNERYKEFRLDVGPLITESFLNKVYNAPEVKSINLIRYGVFDDDKTDSLEAPHQERFSSASMQVKIIAGRQESFPTRLTNTIRGYLRKSQEDSTLVSLQATDETEKSRAAVRRERKQKFSELGEAFQKEKIRLPFPVHEANQIKIEVVIKGKTKVIGLDTSGLLRPYWDISDQVTAGTNGHVLFEEMDLVAKNLLRDVQEGLGFEVR